MTLPSQPIVVRLAVLSPFDRALIVRLRRASSTTRPERWAVPATDLNGDGIQQCARQLAEASVGVSPLWLTQVQTIDEHRSASHLTIAVEYVAVVAEPPPDETVKSGQRWWSIDALPTLETLPGGRRACGRGRAVTH